MLGARGDPALEAVALQPKPRRIVESLRCCPGQAVFLLIIPWVVTRSGPMPHCRFGRETKETLVGDRNLGDARFDYTERYLQWFDYWLKGEKDDALKRPKVRYYQMGANEWVTLRRVILPQLAPGIIGGALLAFIISMDDLVITYFVAGVDSTTLPLFIFSMLRRGVKPEINAIANLFVIFSLVLASIGLYLRRKR